MEPLIPSLASVRAQVPAGTHLTWLWAESKAFGLSVVPSLQSSSGNKALSLYDKRWAVQFTSFAANISCQTTRLFTVMTLDFCSPSHWLMLVMLRDVPACYRSCYIFGQTPLFPAMLLCWADLDAFTLLIVSRTAFLRLCSSRADCLPLFLLILPRPMDVPERLQE